MGDQRERLNAHDMAVRRDKMLTLVRDGRYTWEQIADQCGYGDRSHACKDYHRILKAREEEVAASLDDTRRAHLEGLTELRRVAAEIMRNGGDNALAALDRVAKLDDQIAKLLGLNAPTRVEADGKLTVTVQGISDEDLEGLT